MTTTYALYAGGIQAQTLFATLIVASILHGLGLVFYRLILSPISHFPGPKLTAATGWYETYYDVVKGGQFIFQIEKWHQRYGPIVRISPWEVHISDATFHEVLYSVNSRFEKVKSLQRRFGMPESTFDTIGHEHHRIRRAAIAPFFSRQRVLEMSELIQSKADRLSTRLEKEYAGTGRPVVMTDAWATLTADIISYYSFGLSYDFIDAPEFKTPFTNAMTSLASGVHVMGHFPWLMQIMEAIPRSVVSTLNPELGHVFKFYEEIESQTKKVISGKHDGSKGELKTVFRDILDSKLPPEEKTIERMKQDASSINGAGFETTRSTLAYATFSILHSRQAYQRLYDELCEAIPDPQKMPGLVELEKLLYLNGVVQESLRMSFGTVQRHMRVTPEPIRYGDWVIPPGTRVGMSAYMTHRDERVFPDPETFIPERWSDKSLSRYLVSFNKGPRMCVGKILAEAELFIALATVFRRVRMTLFETDRSDVDMAADYFIPLPKKGSKRVRVVVG